MQSKSIQEYNLFITFSFNIAFFRKLLMLNSLAIFFTRFKLQLFVICEKKLINFCLITVDRVVLSYTKNHNYFNYLIEDTICLKQDFAKFSILWNKQSRVLFCLKIAFKYSNDNFYNNSANKLPHLSIRISNTTKNVFKVTYLTLNCIYLVDYYLSFQFQAPYFFYFA